MLKVSAFYLEKQKSFIPKKKYFLGRCQYQNKKALFTDPIFSEGFALTCLVIVSVRVRNVIETSKFNAQFVEVANEFPKLLAHNG